MMIRRCAAILLMLNTICARQSTADDQLEGIIAAIHARYEPIQFADVAQAKEKVRITLDALERRFAGSSAEAAWKTYLLWADQRAELERTGFPNLDICQRVLRRLTENQPGVEHELFVDLRQSVRELVNTVRAASAQEPQAQFESATRELVSLLRQHGKALDTDRMAEASQLLRKIGQLQQAPEIMRGMRQQILHPNLKLTVPADVVKQYFDQTIDRPYTYRTTLGGASVSGRGQLKAELRSSLVTDAGSNAIGMNVAGVSSSNSVSYENGARVVSRGELKFTSTARIQLTPEGLTTEGFDTNGKLRSEISDWTVPGLNRGLFANRRRQEARQRVYAGHSARIRRAEENALNDLNQTLSSPLRKEISRLNAAYHEHVMLPLRRYDRFPEIKFATSENTLELQATCADPWQLAAPLQQPAIGQTGAVQLAIHESAINNTALALAARRRSLGDIAQFLCGTAAATVESRDPLWVTFDEATPLRVTFRDGKISIELFGRSYRYQQRDYVGAKITFCYRISQSTSEWKLVRASKPVASPMALPTGEKARLGVRDISFRRVMLNILERDFPEEIALGQWNPPAPLDKLGPFTTADIIIADGWFAIATQPVGLNQAK